MSEVKPTPGPWYVVSGAVETRNGIPIASMDREPGNGTRPVERDANARLIAAAPDLLDAVKVLSKWARAYADIPTDHPAKLTPEGLLLAEAAIAKAEGRERDDG